MTLLSDVLNKNVLSKADCRILGFIQSAYFDAYCKKIVYFVIEDGNGSKSALPFSSVTSIADAVIVGDDIELRGFADLDMTVLTSCMYQKNAYDAAGRLKGRINDVVFDNKGKVWALKIGEEEYMPSKLYGVGDVALLKEGAAPRAKRKVKHVLPLDAEDRLVTLQGAFESVVDGTDNDGIDDDEDASAKNPAVKAQHSSSNGKTQKAAGVPVLLADVMKGLDVPTVKPDHSPPRIIADYNFLLGRTLMRDLVSYTGAVLAHANTFVTSETVELARSHGKLIDLTLNSK